MKATHLFLVLFGVFGTSLAWAEEPLPILPVPTPVFFDDTIHHTQHPSQQPKEQTVTPPPTLNLPKLDPSTLSNEELQELNMMYAEDLINIAIINQNWEILQELLEIYEGMPQFDGILSDYAKGAMYRKQGKQKEAIDTYTHILTKRPELSYVKLDLALMLNENKQYKEADALLTELQTQELSEQVQAVITAVRQNIKKQQSITPTLSFNYEATDNVNNASKVETITWLGREWQKESSSLPQSAHGVRYGVGLSKEHNLTDNHNVVAEIDGSGVYYWDNTGYNEQSLRLSAGYKYADLYRSWSIMPFAEQNWLDSEKYNHNTGIFAKYGQILKSSDYLQLFGSYSKKAYEDQNLAKRYDGYITSLGATLNHRLSTSTLLYGGVDGALDDTKDKEVASIKLGIRGGIVQSFENGVGLNANIRYARRNFDAPATDIYTHIRKDNEYQAGLSLWHNKFTYKGFRPQANIRYLKIDSNMPAFYSRDGLNYFMSVERAF